MIRANSHDKAHVVHILEQSFATNPSVNYSLPQDTRRAERLRGLLAYSFEVCHEFGEIYLSDDRRACALLVCPEQKRTTWKAIKRDILLIVRSVGLSKVKALLDRESKIKTFHPSGLHYHLWYIGVLPEYQQQGIGTRLLQEIMALAKQKNRPIYLETSVPTKLTWYQKAGFEVFHQLNFSYTLYLLRLTSSSDWQSEQHPQDA